MRIRFNLRHDTAHQRQLGLLWELKFLERLGEAEPVNMQLYYSSSESLDLELNEHTGKDTKFFAPDYHHHDDLFHFRICGGQLGFHKGVACSGWSTCCPPRYISLLWSPIHVRHEICGHLWSHAIPSFR